MSWLACSHHFFLSCRLDPCFILRHKFTIDGIFVLADELGLSDKQKIEYSFIVDDLPYYAEFNNVPDIGLMFKGGSINIEIESGDLKRKKAIQKLENIRAKFPNTS